MNNRTLRITIGIVLVMIMSLAIILPTTSYALFPRYYPIIRTAPIGGGGDSSIGNSGGSYSGYHGPIWQPQMFYIPGGGGGTSTFSTPSTSNNGQPQAVVTEYSNGAVYQSTPYGTIGHGGVHVPVKPTTSQSTPSGQSTNTQVITITKTYTQYVYDTYEVNHYIYYYMYPIIKWVFTLVNIGQYQQPGYHSVGSEKLFLPGSGSGGIFVPVFAQEAVYTYNIAPTTKPQITGWYTGKTSQSTSGPFLISQSSTPPQLTGVQQAVDNAGQAVSNIQQLATSSGNGLSSKTYVYYGNGSGVGGNININIVTYYINRTNSTTTQPPVLPESWITFWKAGPGGVGGNYIVNYGSGGPPVLVTYNSTVAQQWGQAFQSLGNAISNTLDAIGSALTNVVTAPINILTGFANAIDNAISNGLRAVNLP
jgi:hypothetical protein